MILKALGRDSVPEFQPTRDRLQHFPRTAHFKRARVEEELGRLIAKAKAGGQSIDSIDSIYLRGEEAILEHERRNGYDLEYGPNGVMSSQQENTNHVQGSDSNAIKVKQAVRVSVSK